MARVLLGFAAIVLGASSAHADDSLTLDQAIKLALTRNERAAITDLQAVEADAAVEPAQKKLDTATAEVADTDAQFKAQLVSSNDVTRAKVSLATSVRELSQDRSQLATAYIELGFIINAPPPTVLQAPSALLAAGTLPPPPAEALVKQGLAARPDLVARKAGALASHDFAREPRYRYFPTLMLIGQLPATSTAGPTGHDVDGSIQLAASWSIYAAGARSADIRSRDAAEKIADLQAQELVRSIDADVRTAVRQLAAAQQALAAAQEAATASRKSADETAILYKQGLAKAIEHDDANEQRFSAEVSYAEAEFSVANAYLSLRQATGQGPLEETPK